MELLVLVVALIAVGVLAQPFAHDSRDGFGELEGLEREAARAAVRS